jgi:hypothetical protein
VIPYVALLGIVYLAIGVGFGMCIVVHDLTGPGYSPRPGSFGYAVLLGITAFVWPVAAYLAVRHHQKESEG